jgi:hypothetical protein
MQAVAADEEHDRSDKEKAHLRRQLEIQRAEDKIAALQQEHEELETKVTDSNILHLRTMI